MTVIKVALLQMVASGCAQQANLAKGEAFCRQAKSMGADIVLFPEMWSIGYTLLRVSTPHEHGAWREHEVWGNAYRKLRAYQLLTVPAVTPPFVRADARR